MVSNNHIPIVYSNQFIISDEYVGKRLAYYNGQKFQSILIKEEMCGRKLCEFFLTKRIGFSIHKKKRGKKR